MTDCIDLHAEQRLIGRFANSFDLKAWDPLAGCLARTLYADYSDLRGAPPERMSREQFVESRSVALQHLKACAAISKLN
ncbi:MAG: hypothetical protein ACJ8NR_14105 [Sulfurifustis sp.]